MLPDGERAKGPVVSEMSAKEFTQESLMRTGFGVGEVGRIVTFEPLLDCRTRCRWKSPPARRQLAAGETNNSSRRMGEHRVVGVAEWRVTERAAGELRGEAEYGDDAPAARESVFDCPFRDGASDPVEDVCYSIV